MEGGVPGLTLRPVAGGIRQRVDMYSMKLVNETRYKLGFSEFTNEGVADLTALSDSLFTFSLWLEIGSPGASSGG